MPEAFVLETLRTARTKASPRGGFASVSPVDLLVHLQRELVKRTGADPGRIEDVIIGCASQNAEQGANIARTATMLAGWGDVPGVTINRFCASGIDAVAQAAGRIRGGDLELAAAAAAKEPAGFYSMNTSTCSNPAQVTKKITGTLTLGWSGPFSGPIAPFADAVIQGAKDRFAVQNAAGGIDGVKLAVATKDDQFNPAMTKTNVDGWIQSNSVQAFDVFGSGPLAAVAADQNLACLPELLASATDDTYRDIAKYPWTTEFLPSNNVEEAAEVKVIEAAFPGASKITVAEDQTGSGQSYLNGMEAAVKGTNVVIKKIVPFGTDPGAAAISLQQAGANVVFGALVVPECLQLTEAMAKIGYAPKLTVQASNCGSASLMFAPAGAAAGGQKLVFWEKDPGNPIYSSDAGYNAYVTDATKVDPAHAQPADTYYETGWMIADMDINAFQVAASSSLGLSEVGIMQAARNQNYQPPLFINGIRWIMNANEAYGIMKLQPLVYSAATKSFGYDGSVIDTCPSILSAASCTGGL